MYYVIPGVGGPGTFIPITARPERAVRVHYPQVTPVGSKPSEAITVVDAQLFTRDTAKDYVATQQNLPIPAFVTPTVPVDRTCRILPREVLELSHRDSQVVMGNFLCPTYDECLSAIRRIPESYGPSRFVSF